MYNDINKSNQLKLEIISIVDNINQAEDFLEAIENPQGTIKLNIDLLWLTELYRTQSFDFDLNKMPNVYNVLLDAFKKDMAYQAELLEKYGVELSQTIRDEIRNRRQGNR